MPDQTGSPGLRVHRLLTLLCASAGAALFLAIGMPLPFLFGPMAACLAAALAGVPLSGLGPVSVAARTILGVAVGASITPEVLQALPQIALSVALVPLYVLAIGLIGVPFFRRVCRFDPVTAFYAAMPGGLQDMILFGAEAGGNTRALSLVHATRVLLIVTIVPVLLVRIYGLTLANPIGAPAAEIPPAELLILIAAAFVGWYGGTRIGLFGAAILGPMIVTIALSLLGVIHTRPPQEAVLVAQFFIGMTIGVYYVGVTMAELRRVIAAGVGYVAILAILAIVFAEIVVLSGLAPPVEAFLAFAPGGQAEMTVLAIVAGADLGFVVSLHLVRLIVVISGAPIAARLMGVGR